MNVCPACMGTGRIDNGQFETGTNISFDQPCHICHGSGQVEYVPAAYTDIRKTFERERARQANERAQKSVPGDQCDPDGTG